MQGERIWLVSPSPRPSPTRRVMHISNRAKVWGKESIQNLP